MSSFLKPAVWVQTRVMGLRDRRDDVGGVADEAAMLAVLLGGAVIIGGIVVALLTDAENALNNIDLPGG